MENFSQYYGRETIPIRTANENKCEGKFYYRCYSIMVFVIVFALLLGTAGACVAFALQIVTLKLEIKSLQMASSFQDTFTDSLEGVVHQLNLSHNCKHAIPAVE